MRLLFVTGNSNKVREMQSILQADVMQLSLNLPEIQAIEIDDAIRSKAQRAYEEVKAPVLVEDTGLSFVAWKGLPGALIKWFMDTVGSIGICRMLADETDRTAIAKCSFDLYDGHEHHLFSGAVRGRIAVEPRGQDGFGWDDIFIPDGQDRTFAEMEAEEKNSISMRKIALDELRRFLACSTSV